MINNLDNAIKVNKTINPTKRSNANIEAERGETLLTDMDFDGLPEHYVIAGQKHSNGGTPLNVPKNSFVFSDDKELRIKDEGIQKEFMKPVKATGYTPAELAKKYDINKYRKILADPDSDQLQRDTAEAMIANYNEKLGQLALIQESMKGFEDGIPAVSMPFLLSSGFDMTQILTPNGMEETEDMDEFRLGGAKKVKIKITKLPQMQKGGDSGNIPAYDIEEQMFLKTLSPDVVLPEETVPGMQGEKKGVYGAFDPTKADKNWSWYGKKINWDVPQEVEAAQKAYNERIKEKMKKAGYSDKTADLAVKRIGFVEEKGLPNTLDKLAGKYTETRTDFDIKQLDRKNLSSTEKNMASALAPIQTNPISLKSGKEKAPFWLQDMINLSGAVGDLNRIKKYMPFEAPVDLTTPEATYYDPSREIASVGEQANIAALASAMYAGPQRLSAALSGIQGKAAGSVADILSKYNNLNVSVANENAVRTADIANREAVMQAERAGNLYKGITIANQQFDNAKTALRNNLRTALNTALTNRAQTQALNQMYEQYQIDPTTGGLVSFNKPRPFDTSMLKGTSDGTSQSLEDKVRSIMISVPGISSEIAYKIATQS